MKVTFARDLLGQNPECVELNELLDRADQYIDEGRFEEARQLVQQSIDGCKYLVSKSRAKNETPRSMVIRSLIKNPTFISGVLLFIAFIAIILIEAYRMAKKKEEEMG